MDNGLKVLEFQAGYLPEDPNKIGMLILRVSGVMSPADTLRLYMELCELVKGFELESQNSLDLAKFISES